MSNTTNEKLIEFVKVTKTFGAGENSKIALKNISLSINSGDFVGILGMNGSGKSTLARLTNALLQPTSGKIYVNGLNTSEPKNLRSIRRSVGMVFQNPENQLVSSVVEEDIAFGPENLGLSQTEVRQRVETVIQTLEIEDIRYRAPHLLSGGQKQKVAIASALAMLPSCLILDEPTSMLDPKARLDLLNYLSKINQLGITIILITHNVEDIMGANRLVFLHQGMIQLEGTPETCLASLPIIRELGFSPPDLMQLINNLNRRGHNIGPGITNWHDLVEFICRK